VLNFGAPPTFQPKAMPPRLRRVNGKPLSARPRPNRRPRGAAPARAKAPRRQRAKKRGYSRLAYRILSSDLLTAAAFAALPSSLRDKLYKMYGIYQGLSAHAATMWRRRPHVDFRAGSHVFLTRLTERPVCTPARTQLEPRLLGESIRLVLFSFVSREPVIEWSAYPFGQLPDEGERMAI
jgi:hypothetical protein